MLDEREEMIASHQMMTRSREAMLDEREQMIAKRHAMINERERRVFGDRAVAAGLNEVFDRFSSEIAECGWDAMMKKWTQEAPPSSRSGQLAAGSSWTVIPGNGGGCRDTVIVFLDDEEDPGFVYNGRGGAIGLMRHLVECQKIRRVMILTTQYSRTGFRRRMLPWIRAWENRGIAFAAALVGPDDRQLVPLAVGS